MLIEWLKNEILTKATWHNDIPGICICQFEWIGPVNEAVNPFPTEQTSQLIEMFFCVEGEIIAQRGDTCLLYTSDIRSLASGGQCGVKIRSCFPNRFP